MMSIFGAWPQRLPHFTMVCPVVGEESSWGAHLTSLDADTVYLLERDPESGALATFIEYCATVGAHGDVLDCFKIRAAYNLDFAGFEVALCKRRGTVIPQIRNLRELMERLLETGEDAVANGKARFYVSIAHACLEKAIQLQTAMYQQFFYLGIFLPLVCRSSQKNFSGVQIWGNILKGDTTYLVHGTKKAGKSAFISALLRGQYCPISSELPTPVPMLFAPGKTLGKKIECKMRQGKKATHFSSRAHLCDFLSSQFTSFVENGDAFASVSIRIPQYPSELRHCRFVEVPATNFAGVHAIHTVPDTWYGKNSQYVFIVNYSSHLTDDEKKALRAVYEISQQREAKAPLLIVVNRMDEMYSSDVVKSPIRFLDYLRHRLGELGFTNVLLLPSQSMLAVYLDKILPYLREGELSGAALQELRKIYACSNLTTCIKFLDDFVQNMQDFHEIEIKSIVDAQKFSGLEMFVLLLSSQFVRDLQLHLPQDFIKTEVLDASKKVFAEAQQKVTISAEKMAQDSKKMWADAQKKVLFARQGMTNMWPQAFTKIKNGVTSFVRSKYRPGKGQR